MPKSPDLDFRALYARFQSPIAQFDCGRKCSPFNEAGIPFCCDTRHAIPSAYSEEWNYLQGHTNLWHPWQAQEPDETQRLQEETPHGQVLIACLGPDRCQREFRSLTCRSFPFFPYIHSEGEFVGLSYYWEYEDRCWVISNLQVVTQAYRGEYISAFDFLFERMPQERQNFLYHSEVMRQVFTRRRRTIPLLHRDGFIYSISPKSGKMRKISIEQLPKFGPYQIADLLPFPDEPPAHQPTTGGNSSGPADFFTMLPAGHQRKRSTSAPNIAAEFTLPEYQFTRSTGPVTWVTLHALRHWPFALLMFIGAIGNAFLASLVPVLVGLAFNDILASPPNLHDLARIPLLIAGSQLLRGILQLTRTFSAEMIAQRLERDIREELYISLLGKSMTFHSLQQVGDIMTRATNDVREINLMFSPGLNLVIGSGIFLLMPIILAPRYHYSLVLVPALFVIAYFLALWQYLHELKPVTAEVRESFGQVNTRLAEAIDGIETVKGASQEREEVDRFERNARRYRNATVRQGYIEARFIPALLLSLVQAGGFLHAIYLFHLGLINTGGVVAFFGLLQLFNFPTFTSLFAYSQLSLGLAGAERILELIRKENNLDQNASGYSSPMRGEVEFRNVCFRYDSGEPVLEDISFKVQPGQTVAIVGQTGSGKTSLVKLINRTYDATSGQVLVDGVDVRDWNLEALRRNISIIEQDIFLFSRPISDNIAFGKPDASQEEIEAASRAAQAHDFVTSFKDGYQTVIGERGVTLSGGQRQRLALGRAFLTDPRILILDDSTSSIDSATEDKIQRAIYAAARGRTTFIITHRLSQIRWANLILVLRHGRLAAIGTHDELMASSEAYRRIFTEDNEARKE